MKNLLFILLLGLGFSQTEWTTRIYTFDFNISEDDYMSFDIVDITGYNLSDALISLVNVEDGSSAIYLLYGCDFTAEYVFLELNNQIIYQYASNLMFKSGRDCHFMNVWNNSFNASITLAITAEFPEEDTGYIEEGFEFCVQPGANLLSFPCDSSIEVSECLPSGIENFIEAIIGQGVATEYNPSLGWVGSLDEFDPGSGYWFKSNSSLCFEYECVED